MKKNRMRALATRWSAFVFVACASARAESPEWVRRDVVGPAARASHAMVYDASRGVVVLFGGAVYDEFGETLFGDTWEWNGTNWSLRSTSGPSPRSGHGLAFDTARHVTVLFGGHTAQGQSAETWEWDGTSWSNRTAPVGPTARSGAAMAFDAARGRCVMHAGFDSSITANFQDTWTWEGSGWLHPSNTGPSARVAHAMCFDSSRARVVMFGGYSGVAEFGDTWEWDGTGWMQKSAQGAEGRDGHAMVYDAARHVTVLFGGFGGFGLGPLSDTREWNGTAWQLLATEGPSARYGHAMAYDTARQATVLFGGWSVASTSDETWELVAPSACPCDLNHDGVVDDADFSVFVFAYNILDCADGAMPAECPADFTHDQLVDDADFVFFVPAYNALLCP